MKLSNIFFFSFVAWCFLSISAYSQLPSLIHWDAVPSRVYTLEEVRQLWITTHYDVYHEDCSGKPWAQSVQAWLTHAFSDNLVPFYYAVTTQKVSRVLRDDATTYSVPGLEFDGVWPVFILYSSHGRDLMVPPEWCTVQEYLNILSRFGSSVLHGASVVWDEVSNDSSLRPKYLRVFDDTPGYWSARLLVSNSVTSSRLLFELPMTRLYLMLPYYPSWWAANGIYYAVDYDSALMLCGPSLGDDAPWADYDGFVLFSQKPVKFSQKYRWVSK